jgi:predicted RNA-binding Zn-ribbon protein involved in translation (DUF1610 family)
MIEKCPCQQCGVNIEFEIENANQFVPCPSCGKETRLLMPGTSEHAQTTLAAKLATRTGGKTVPCVDCGHKISRRAFFCPSCGSIGSPFLKIFYIVCCVVMAGVILDVIGLIINKIFSLF